MWKIAAALALVPSIASAETFGECFRRWSAWEEQGLVERSYVKDGELLAIVNERHFSAITFREKSDIASTLDCITGGPDDVTSRIRLLSDLTNKELAVWMPDTGLVVP